ncbi:arginine biosynthesis bifunctional protein ArgJ, mitochondrial [[Candida] railenensis]|uniref:Arginine biosynthesis bifunctional protein ArgJ, mitochondrial n=1 Tax=[Candida] railenensis TaxID=45579 RepID=A0A9P0W0F2_9ASCO|nr:arginine biosynthesis bifunctional protein ArgJ, mitochondrial [[Candida] railenensis]
MLSFVRFTSSKAAKYVPTSGVYPKGFVVGGIHCGVKKDGKSLDLAMLKNVYHEPATASAVFTKNKFKAAPVQVSRKILDNNNGNHINSIIVNSGNANAVTGKKGYEDAQAMVDATDKAAGNSESNSTLVMSTGVIGNLLPIDNILSGIPKLAESDLGSSHDHWIACAKAICTTDTFPKLVSKNFEIDGITYTLAGLAKGAGMICPNMATLLGFFATDAPISEDAIKVLVANAVARSFNSISVDGDMSTNDTIVGIANGAAGGQLIDLSKESKPKFDKLQEEFTSFAQQLAQLVVRDGEGATKFITINVKDAQSYSDAHTVAKTISNSSLVKTAMYGKDANWGRILCSIGYSEVEAIIPERTNVSFVPADGSAKLDLLVNGEPQQVDEERASEILEFEDLRIEIELGTGGGEDCEFWTCDLTHEYITINGDYRS